MTTQLNQRRVKSGDPAYPSLQEQLSVRLRAEGEGYIMPIGGIPRGDMTDDVQLAIGLAEGSYQTPDGGIPKEDLSAIVQASLTKADSAFQMPMGGLTSDLFEPVVRSRLDNFAALYIYPITGIPYVDVDDNVKEMLDKAVSAYQKPGPGIPRTDMSADVQATLEKADEGYQKPEGGIPLADLETPVATAVEQEALAQELADHAADRQLHTRDHLLMENIGTFTHEQIDDKLNVHEESLTDFSKELKQARGVYGSLDNRISSVLFSINDYTLTGDALDEGTLTDLVVTEEGYLRLPYTPEKFRVEFYNTNLTTPLETQEFDDMRLSWPNNIVTGALPDKTYINATGYLYAPVTGLYRFNIQATGDYTLTVDKISVTSVYQNILQIYADDEPGYYFDVNLKGGQFYPFVISGLNRRRVDSYLKVFWRTPNASSFAVLSKADHTTTGFNAADEGSYISKAIDTLDMKVVDWSFAYDIDQLDYDYLIGIQYRMADADIEQEDWSDVVPGDVYTGIANRYVQFKATVVRNELFRSPAVRSLTFHYTSSRSTILDDILNARGSKDSLAARVNLVDDMALQAIRLVEDAEILNPAWLADARFEHIDLNILRMQLQMAKTLQAVNSPGMIQLMNGFVQDFTKDDFFVTAQSDPYLIDGSSRVKMPISQTIWDVDADWLQWTRMNMGPDAGSLRLTTVGGGAASALNAVVANLNQYASPIPQNSETAARTVYQPFYINPDDQRIYSVQAILTGGQYSYSYQYVSGYDSQGRPIYSWATAGPYNWTINTRVYLVPSRPSDGLPDTSREVLLGTMSGYNLSGSVDSLLVASDVTTGLDGQRLTPNGKIKMFIKFVCDDYSYSSGNYTYTAYNHLMTQSVVATQNTYVTALNGDNTKADKMFLLNSGFGVMTNQYFPMTIVMQKAVTTQGEASIVKDYGKMVEFLGVNADINFRDGVVDLVFQSSEDGIEYSEPTHHSQQIPSGRYLKVKVAMNRVLSNQSPDLRKLTINYRPAVGSWISNQIPLTKIPTHLVFDALDTGNGDFSYFASRDGGLNFVSVIPGMQNDLRTLPAGTSLVIKVVGKEGRSVNAGIEHILAQALVHDNFQKGTTVAQHEEYTATAEQTEFYLDKAYYIGDHSLQVFKDGKLMSVGIDYEETTNLLITFLTPMIGGERILFRVAAAAYPFGNAEALGQHIDELAIDMEGFVQRADDIQEHLDAVDATHSVIAARLDSHDESITDLHSRDSDLQNQIDANKQAAEDAIAAVDLLAHQNATRLNDYEPMLVGTVMIDETEIGNGKLLAYDELTNRLRYINPPDTQAGGTPVMTQVNKLGVQATTGTPAKFNLEIPLTMDFNRPATEVLKLDGSQANMSTVIMNFNAGDSSSFVTDPYVNFDGMLKLIQVYAIPTTVLSTVGVYKILTGTINRASFKTIERVDIN